MQNEPSSTEFLPRPKWAALPSGKQAKVCPRCASPFVTERECESCGVQFHENRFAGIDSDRSFYALKEDYWRQVPWPVKFLPIFDVHSSALARSFTRAILIRLKALVVSLGHTHGVALEKIHWVEIEAIVEALADHKVEQKRVLKSFEEVRPSGVVMARAQQLIHEAYVQGTASRNSYALFPISRFMWVSMGIYLVGTIGILVACFLLGK